MRVIEFSPFFQENLVAGLKIAEGRDWITEQHIVEANRTYRNVEKSYVFDQQGPNVRYHRFDASRVFVDPGFGLRPTRYFPFIRKANLSRRNQRYQRNLAHKVLGKVDDDDIVIFSDLDEIIDSSKAEFLIAETRKHGIITIRLHHTMYFLNYYLLNLHEAFDLPFTDWSHRVFLMTGAAYRRLPRKNQQLRWMGEGGMLYGKIHCTDEICGFHHSFLGDAAAIKAKITAYSHGLEEHSSEILDPETGEVSVERIRNIIDRRGSVIDWQELEVRSIEEQPLLRAVSENPEKYEPYILSKPPAAM